jgi:phosphatidate phosphatase APP1
VVQKDDTGDVEGAKVPVDDESGRSIGDVFDELVRSERTASWVSGLEDRLSRFRRERKVGKGTLRNTHITAYRGYVANGLAYVRLRVTEEPVVPAAADAISDREVLQQNLRRFFALSFAGVRVKVEIDGRKETTTTARHGYATASIPVDHLKPGWLPVSVATQPVDPWEEVATAESAVLVPDPQAPIWVVSDIDDTVLQTGLAEGLTAVKNTLMRQATTRRAIPGMASLYQAIARGVDGQGAAPFFYLSTGSWAFYDVLVEFLEVRGFPQGPLFLTDWAPQERYITRSGSEHKRSTLRRLFAAYPDAKFLLIGDSGQRDPYNYSDLAQEFPNSVAHIVIIDCGIEEKAEEVRQFAATRGSDEVPFTFAADAGRAAEALAAHGLINPGDVITVRDSLKEGDADA